VRDERLSNSGSITILVVEDSERYRRIVVSELRQRVDSPIVYEVSDGLEAVQRAEEQKPDLILLDIGLPGLNGIQVGRLIRKVSPASKILFVSQETSPEIIQEALHIGAGFLRKSNGGLLIAVDAILQGRTLPSTELRPQETGLFHNHRPDT